MLLLLHHHGQQPWRAMRDLGCEDPSPLAVWSY